MRIARPARKHGVADEDMLHAVRNYTAERDDDGDVLLVLGPGRDGTLIEVGILNPGSEDPVIIHALPFNRRGGNPNP